MDRNLTSSLTLAFTLSISAAVWPATFVVDDTGDGVDVVPGDGTCSDGTGAPNCTLRAAIMEANALAGADNIHFSHAGATSFTPASAYPIITEQVTIDGTTDPDFVSTPVVELNGTSAGAAAGLKLQAASSFVRGLVINRFSTSGITLQVGDGTAIEGCYIGTDVAGTAALANGIGIFISNSNNHIMGGTTAAARNLISGNTAEGVLIQGSTSGATGNQILGNYIGTDVNGTADLGNGTEGIEINTANAKYSPRIKKSSKDVAASALALSPTPPA